jgi:hypothetical protein
MLPEVRPSYSFSEVWCCHCLQDILNVVMESGQDFDTVCMATAVHRMAKMDAGNDFGFMTSIYIPFTLTRGSAATLLVSSRVKTL